MSTFPSWIKPNGYVMLRNAGNYTWIVGKITKSDSLTVHVKHSPVLAGDTQASIKKYFELKDNKAMIMLHLCVCHNSIDNNDNTLKLYNMDAPNEFFFMKRIKSKQLKLSNYLLVQNSVDLVKADLSKLMALSALTNTNENNESNNNTMNDLYKTMGFSYNIQYTYNIIVDYLITNYYVDINVVSIIISYLLENKLSLNMPCFDNIVELIGCNKGNNSKDNNSNNKIWKSCQSHSISFEFMLNKDIKSFYGIEIDIDSTKYKKTGGVVYAFLKQYEYKKYPNSYYNSFYKRYTATSEYGKYITYKTYLSEKDTINDVNEICLDNPNKIFLYVKDNQCGKVDLTKYITLTKNFAYSIEIIVTRDIKVDKYYKLKNKKFSLGRFNYIKYGQSWMPAINMLIGEKQKRVQISSNDKSSFQQPQIAQ